MFSLFRFGVFRDGNPHQQHTALSRLKTSHFSMRKPILAELSAHRPNGVEQIDCQRLVFVVVTVIFNYHTAQAAGCLQPDDCAPHRFIAVTNKSFDSRAAA